MSIAGRNIDSLRRANLSSVLEMVHRSGGVSRSQLTGATGLTRSTVAVLVGELVDLGLVVEREPQTTNRVGRPSPVVTPASAPVAIAVNPELDAVTVGVVGLCARVEHRMRHPVDHIVTAEETVEIVSSILDSLMGGVLHERPIYGVGVAVPGLVRADGLVRWAPHLGWRDSPIADQLTDVIGVPAFVGNDASLGALAELIFGVGRGAQDLVYLNGGASGIGGGVVAGGTLLGGTSGYAGEFGQNRPGVTGADDRATADGVLEDEVSQARLLRLLGADALDEIELERRVLASADPELVRELARQRRILAVALGNAVNVLNPSLVVLGGFLATLHASEPAALPALIRASSVDAAWEDATVAGAALGADRLLIGAAEIAFRDLLRDPSGATSVLLGRGARAADARPASARL